METTAWSGSIFGGIRQSWLFAFPVVLIVAPIARQVVDWIMHE